MKKKLWIPILTSKPDSYYNTQSKLCSEQMDNINLPGQTGGCYGIVCGLCILHSANCLAYEKWANDLDSNAHDTSTKQRSLFD